MCIYLFFDLFLFVMVLLYNNRNTKKLFVVSTIILITLLGLHDGTGDPKGYGYDYPDYLNFFKGAPSVYGSVDSPILMSWNGHIIISVKYLDYLANGISFIS